MISDEYQRDPRGTYMQNQGGIHLPGAMIAQSHYPNEESGEGPIP